MDYIYLGDRLTDPALRGMACSAVRRAGKCVRGKNGSMLVVDEQGVRHVVIGRLLRKVPTTLDDESLAALRRGWTDRLRRLWDEE